MKLKLLIINRNEVFANNFANYVNSHYRGEISIAVYTNLDSLIGVSLKPFDMIIVENAYYPEVSEVVEFRGKVIVHLTNGTLAEEYAGSYNVNAFSESEKIISYLMMVYEKENKTRLQDFEKANKQMIGFFSPSGGIGKTTLSLVAARMFALQDRRVLYFSMDYFMNMNYYYKSNEKNDLTFILATIAEDKPIDKEMSEIIIQDKDIDCLHYINGFGRYSDRLEVSQEHFQIFVDKLKELVDYDVIVIDIPSDVDRKSQAILETLTNLFIVTSKSTVDTIKFKAFKSYMTHLKCIKELQEDIYIIYNNATNINWDRPLLEDEYPAIDIDYDSDFKVFDKTNELLRLETHSVIGTALKETLDKINDRI